MNKIIIAFFVLICTVQKVKSQKNVNVNWTILVNEKIEPKGITRSKILVKTLDSTEHIFNVWCYAGNLEIKQPDFNKILSEEVVSIWLVVPAMEANNYNNYKIKVKKKWFKLRYMVLKIYNLKKKKYRKLFAPNKSNKDYVYEIDFPGASMRLLRKG